VPYNPTQFRDRADAGRRLADRLLSLELNDPIVLAVPAGGVPVGAEIATRLSAPLDLIIVRKIRIPWNPEAGLGAVTSGGEALLNPRLTTMLGLDDRDIQRLADAARTEVAQRERIFRGERAHPALSGRTVILVDDGLASGYTMLAAVRSVQRREPSTIVVAVPAASGAAVGLLEPEVDQLVALYVHPRHQPFAVASSYEQWHDLTDDEVLALLKHVWDGGTGSP